MTILHQLGATTLQTLASFLNFKTPFEINFGQAKLFIRINFIYIASRKQTQIGNKL